MRTYFLHGGIEAIYVDVPEPLGLLTFAPAKPAIGTMFSARRRAGLEGDELAPVVPEAELERRPRSTEPPTKQVSAPAQP